jgi:hypothetical protein
MTLSNSASLGALKLVGSLAVGLGVALFSVASGCSSDDSTAGTGGGAGTTSGTAGAGGSPSEGGAGTAGSGTGGSTSDGGGVFCARPQMASDIGDHCIPDSGITIKTEASECLSTAGDAAAQSTDGGGEYNFSHSGTTADDDNCKYDVSYGIEHAMDSCMAPRGPAVLHVTLKSRITGMGVPGANPSIEAFLDDTHPLPNTPKQVVTDEGMGNYTIAGVGFDAEGAWTVRFHFFETCAETEKTKHGHVAFTVLVSTPQ